jgi:hypothetical protein
MYQIRTKIPLRQNVFSLLLLIPATILISACDIFSSDTEPYSTPVTFETITDHKEQEFIFITGKLTFLTECYMAMSGGGTDNCRLYFVSTEMASDLHALPNLTIHAYVPWLIEGKDPSPNFMQLVGGVDDENVRLYTNDRQTLTIDDPVQIIGKITDISQFEGDTTINLWVVKIKAVK